MGFGGGFSGGTPDFLKRSSPPTARRGMIRNRSFRGFQRGKRPTRPTQARY